MSWMVKQCDREIHVTPILDRRHHELAANCSCLPRTEPKANHPTLYVHNAWDGREITERAVEALQGAKN